MLINKIISGGQTGADRAALDFALKHNIPYGGWVPKVRKAEDGCFPDYYEESVSETNWMKCLNLTAGPGPILAMFM